MFFCSPLWLMPRSANAEPAAIAKALKATATSARFARLSLLLDVNMSSSSVMERQMLSRPNSIGVGENFWVMSDRKADVAENCSPRTCQVKPEALATLRLTGKGALSERPACTGETREIFERLACLGRVVDRNYRIGSGEADAGRIKATRINPHQHRSEES